MSKTKTQEKTNIIDSKKFRNINNLKNNNKKNTNKRNNQNIKNNKEKNAVRTAVKTKRKIKVNNRQKNTKTKNNRRTQTRGKQNKTSNNTGKLKVIPLGGMEEIGKNLTVFEYDDEIVIVDCGMAFPDDDMLGIDVVLPDYTYLRENKEKIKGIFITHGHEDHIGGIPYFLKEINVPVYATPFAMELIKIKLKEHKLLNSAKLHIVTMGETIDTGLMSVEFIQSTHSIPDAAMIAIKTPIGNILHTGDFKIELTPVDGKRIDFGRIAQLGNEGLLAVISDSTNSERKGYTVSELSVGHTLEEYFDGSTKRIIVATFASNVHRIQQLVNLAVKYKRKVAISGRSMMNMLDITKRLEYIDVPENVFIDMSEIENYPDEKILVITTGSQGEPMSALTRVALGEHRQIKAIPNDLVIISATPIPGNEPSVTRVIDILMKRNIEVVYSALEHVHVSGHACQEEQKLMLAITKPKYFIPAHGNVRHLHAHRNNAMQMGYTYDNIFILENGKGVEFTKESAQYMKEKVKAGKVFVDGLGVGDVGNLILRDRQHLSQDGMIISIISIDSATKELVGTPDIISRGFVYVKESEELVDEMKQIIIDKVKGIKNGNWKDLKQIIGRALGRFVFKETKRDPMIIPIIVEV